MEEWKSILGYDGYEASTAGRIRSAATQRVKKPSPDKAGYLRVCLRQGAAQHVVRVARLVAAAFLPGFDIHNRQQEIDHIDRDKTHNAPFNLRIADKFVQSQNRNHTNAARGKRCPVEQLHIVTGQVLAVHESVNAAGRAVGGNGAGNINKVLTGKAKTAYGFGWRYQVQQNTDDLPGEEWRPFEDVFISNKGRIKRRMGTGYRIQEVSAHSKKTGYPTTMICGKDWPLHKLVAHIYLDAAATDRIRHKDGDVLNPASDNLAISNRTEIAQAAEERGRKRHKIGIAQYDQDGSLVGEYPSIAAASEATGIDASHISKCVRGVFSKAVGYVWQAL